MNESKSLRTWRLDIPSAGTMDFHYKFDVSFDVIEPHAVVVGWSETTIGCGLFRLCQEDASGDVFLKAWKRLALLAVTYSRMGTAHTPETVQDLSDW